MYFVVNYCIRGQFSAFPLTMQVWASSEKSACNAVEQFLPHTHSYAASPYLNWGFIPRSRV